jgi:hypothetical protein
MPAGQTKRELGKSKLSMFLRTKCDRELYLSLFSNNPVALKAAGIPIPLKSRPGVELITNSGREFEYDQFDTLISALPGNVLHKSNGRASVDLLPALKTVQAPTFILQPEIEPEQFRDLAFKHLGVADADKPFIPQLKGLRPDVLYVAPPGSSKFEILPDGSRKSVNANDSRRPISVIDLKNITEANASYSAEVCLYAFFLANWLQVQDPQVANGFFVSDQVYLWRHVEMPKFTKIMSAVAGGNQAKRITALLEDLKDGVVNYLVYMPSVRKFFVEDVPRVVRKGDTEGWQAVPYHVNPRCGSCDWLGNKNWLSPDDLVAFTANPTHYCFHSAEADDHLSKMANLSVGAAQVLHMGGHPKVADLVGISSNAIALKKHTLLKKDRMQIGARAGAIVHNTISVDQIAKVGGLARYWSAEYDVIVNFDSGSGFLTGIALRGVLSAPYGQSFAAAGQPSKGLEFLGEAAFVVPKDNLSAEWSALQAFIDKLAEWVEHSEKVYSDNGWGKVHTQICLWEARQYEELCNAFGRHLLKILDLSSKAQKALAWIFPSEKLMEREDEICPSIVFIRDVINSSVLLPQRFAVTLLGTAGHYHHSSLVPRKIDKYHVEPLGDAIPRERIFDIWKSPTGTVKLFGKVASIADAIDRYGSVLKAHAFALGSITARLRGDLKNVLSGNAPALKLSIPAGMTGVAHDSKLWGQWSDVSAAADQTTARLGLITRPEWLESAYKAVVFEGLVTDHGNHQYTFTVSEESTEAKIEEGDSYCVVGIIAWPGFPLQTTKSLNLPINPLTYGYYMPVHSLMAAKLESFDRANRVATVSFRPKSAKAKDAFDALMTAGIVPVAEGSIYLMDGLPYDDTFITTAILKQIGNPKCAKTALESLEAMGKSAAKKIPAGTDADTPIARVLWTAKKLSITSIRSGAEIASLASFAKTANVNPLNPSQLKAVQAVADVQLSIIWGPPGTGKTDTLVAFLHAVVREAKQRKILITGPNYRAVEELASRLALNVGNDPSAPCDFYWVYSRNREPKTPPTVGPHTNLKSLTIDSLDSFEMVQSMSDQSRTTIIATTAHILNQFIEKVSSGGTIVEIFDLVVIDESSQVPVTLALRPLCALRAMGQLVVVGDHLQMPPINSLEPPVGAEHLVSSIQTYLIERFGIIRQELLTNYRSNQDLVDYAKTLGYPSQLSAFNTQKDLHLMQTPDTVIAALPADIPTTDAYKLLLDPTKRVCALIHDDPISSQANEIEAGLVAGLAYCVRHCVARELETGTAGTKSNFDDDSFFEFGIGIVTPHKAQKALVVRALLKLFPNADAQKVYDSVDTVERFQGGERQTIIVSFGVGDTDIIEGEEAFLLQMERTNVAVSRAMAKCIVLMPKALAYHLPTDAKAAEASVAIKSYIEEFCRHRTATTVTFDGLTRGAEVRWH